MIAIAKSLYFDSNVVSFDEPTSALSEPEIERLFKIIHSMKEKGITILCNCSEPLLTAGRSQRSQQKQLSKLHKR